MNGKPSGLVVAPEPLAAQVGNKILTQGGNAVDAAVAAAFAQGVVNPLLCGIGGSGYILVHHAPKMRAHRLFVRNGSITTSRRLADRFPWAFRGLRPLCSRREANQWVISPS